MNTWIIVCSVDINSIQIIQDDSFVIYEDWSRSNPFEVQNYSRYIAQICMLLIWIHFCSYFWKEDTNTSYQRLHDEWYISERIKRMNDNQMQTTLHMYPLYTIFFMRKRFVYCSKWDFFITFQLFNAQAAVIHFEWAKSIKFPIASAGNLFRSIIHTLKSKHLTSENRRVFI